MFFKTQIIIYSIFYCEAGRTEASTVQRVRPMAEIRDSSLASDQARDMGLVLGLLAHYPSLVTALPPPQCEPLILTYFLPTCSEPKIEVSSTCSTSGLHIPFPTLKSQNYESCSESSTLLALLSLPYDNSLVASTVVILGLVSISYKPPVCYALFLYHGLTCLPQNSSSCTRLYLATPSASSAPKPEPCQLL